MPLSQSGRRFQSTARVAGLAAAALCLTEIGQAAPAWTDLGAVPDSQSFHATVWLGRRDEAGFQSALKAIYDPASPRFHHWLTPGQYAAYMPDATSVATLRDALARSGLTIVSTAEDGSSIDVSADAATIQHAFATSMHRFESSGATFISTTSRPKFYGASGASVAAITGLDTPRMHPYALRQVDPATGRPVALAMPRSPSQTTASGSPLQPFLTDDCFHGFTTTHLDTLEGYVTFRGRREVNGYFTSGSPGDGVCGYDATQLRSHYKLNDAVRAGLDGKGQTIAIVVAYGSPFIIPDVNAYSTLTGLPLLGADDFKQITPLGIPLTYDSGWSAETTIDVSMSHAIAPGAKIVLLAAPTADTSQLLETFEYAVHHQLADIVSMSFGEPEYGSDGSDEIAWGIATAEAASYGVGVTVSSGDAGDNGAGQPQGAPSVPADSSYVTSVGGTTLSLPTAEGHRDVGWGWQSTYPNANRVERLKLQVARGQLLGSGGGESVYFGKPFWQDALPGEGRQGPDIAAIADPLTGADLVLTADDYNYLVQVVTVAGGTSVAAPVFAGISALANQRAGERIGQVAPLLPGLQGTPLTDIVPFTAQEPKMTATLQGKPVDTPDVTFDALALLPEGVDDIEQIFVVRPVLSMTIFTYGLDTSLNTAVGWDNMTGYGEPNGIVFVDALAKAAKAGEQ